jgi:hypothetical protein
MCIRRPAPGRSASEELRLQGIDRASGDLEPVALAGRDHLDLGGRERRIESDADVSQLCLTAEEGEASPWVPRDSAVREAKQSNQACANRAALQTFKADVDIPKGGAESMIVTQGGRFSGYGFYAPTPAHRYPTIIRCRSSSPARSRRKQPHDLM